MGFGFYVSGSIMVNRQLPILSVQLKILTGGDVRLGLEIRIWCIVNQVRPASQVHGQAIV
jgi:hypothetical protein